MRALRTTRLLTLLTLAAGLAGCPPEVSVTDDRGAPDVGPLPDGGPPDGGPSALHPAAQRWLTAASDNGWRYFRFVERCDPAVCGLDEAGWQTRRLFDGAAATPPDDLRQADATRYMLFEWILPAGDDPTAARDAAATALSGLHGAGLDLETAELYPPRVHPMAVDDLRTADQTAWRRLGGARVAPLEGAPDQVQVMVLDTVGPASVEELYRADRAALTAAGRATHGLDVAATLHDAACGWAGGDVGTINVACPIDVQTRVALDLAAASDDGRGRDGDFGGFELRPEGGHFGDPGGVAQAIWEATAAWSRRAARERPGLALVLALGWPDAEGASVSSEAAQLALDYARCNGVLVVSAFGNADLPASGRGALRPAAFTEAPACEAFDQPGLAAPHVTVAGARWPARLTHGRRLAPLHNARAWSAGIEPMAFAWGEGVRTLGGEARWTGSSVAAGLYAAAAAVAWIRQVTPDRPAGVVAPQIAIDALHALTLDQGQLVRPCAATDDCTEALPALNPAEMDPAPLVSAAELPAECGPAMNMTCGNGLLLERADPQPDEPVCDVCALSVGAGAEEAIFTLKAKFAAWPASDDLIYAASLKIVYANSAAQFVSLTLDHYRDAIDGSPGSFVDSGLELDQPFSQIDTVTIIGLKKDAYGSVVSFAESAWLDP